MVQKSQDKVNETLCAFRTTRAGRLLAAHPNRTYWQIPVMCQFRVRVDGKVLLLSVLKQSPRRIRMRQLKGSPPRGNQPSVSDRGPASQHLGLLAKLCARFFSEKRHCPILRSKHHTRKNPLVARRPMGLHCILVDGEKLGSGKESRPVEIMYFKPQGFVGASCVALVPRRGQAYRAAAHYFSLAPS